MGGGGHGASTTYKGVTMHHPKRWHTITGKGLCAVMWFWVLYRAKQDGPVVLGWRHPWEGHEDHSHGHGDQPEVYASSFCCNLKPFDVFNDLPSSFNLIIPVDLCPSLYEGWYHSQLISDDILS